MCGILLIIFALWIIIGALVPVFGFAGIIVKYWWVLAIIIGLWFVCCIVYGMYTAGKGEE